MAVLTIFFGGHNTAYNIGKCNTMGFVALTAIEETKWIDPKTNQSVTGHRLFLDYKIPAQHVVFVYVPYDL